MEEQKFYIEICREMGIVGMTIAYQDNITFKQVYEIINNRIDNNKDLVFKVEPKGSSLKIIKNRNDFTDFITDWGDC